MTRIRAVALDVDGVLTDGGFWWGPDGEEWKRFCFADVMGISLARKSGLIIALVSGEDSPLVDRYASKMGITDVHKNCKDKAEAVWRFAQLHGLDLSQVAFMGDDVNDLEALRLVGLAAAPSDARPVVLREASYVATKRGGDGAVRELLDAILEAKSPARSL